MRHAIELADAEGLDAVTMRVLAAGLDVPVMSLYRHVSGKDDLIAAMVDTVLERGWRPVEGVEGWRSRLEHEARQEWQLYRRHPWLLRVLATMRQPINRSVLAAIDRSMTTLTHAGLDSATAMAVYLTISGYVQGAALPPAAEADAERDSGVGRDHWWAGRLRELAGAVDSGRYPWLTALAVTPAARGPSAADLRGWFEFGLERVLDGVAVFVDGDDPLRHTVLALGRDQFPTER